MTGFEFAPVAVMALAFGAFHFLRGRGLERRIKEWRDISDQFEAIAKRNQETADGLLDQLERLKAAQPASDGRG